MMLYDEEAVFGVYDSRECEYGQGGVDLLLPIYEEVYGIATSRSTV